MLCKDAELYSFALQKAIELLRQDWVERALSVEKIEGLEIIACLW